MLVLIPLIFLAFSQVDNYFLKISMILINYRLWFDSFISDFYLINSPVASAALWNTFLEAVFRASSPVLVAASNHFFPYLLDRFVANYKYLYTLTYFLVFGSIE